MGWDIDKIQSIPSESKARGTTSVGGFDSYWTVYGEWVGLYYNTLNPENNYYDTFLYEDTDNINPNYVIDEAIVEAELAAVTVGSGTPLDAGLLDHVGGGLFGVGHSVFNGLSDFSYIEAPADLHVKSIYDIYRDWSTSPSFLTEYDAWASPDIVKLYTILEKTYKDTGGVPLETYLEGFKREVQSPYGIVTGEYNATPDTFDIDFNMGYFSPAIHRVANPAHPNYLLYMSEEAYDAYIPLRSFFESIGGDMSWMDTWDGLKVEADVTIAYFGSVIECPTAPVIDYFVNHPQFLPRYSYGRTSASDEGIYFTEIGSLWYVNGYPIYRADDPAGAPATTNSPDRIVAADTKIYSLGAMITNGNMSVVLDAVHMPYFLDITGNVGNTVTDMLINGMGRPIFYTEHCLSGGTIHITEYHDARICLGDGGFTIGPASFLWSKRNYLAPVAGGWHGKVFISSSSAGASVATDGVNYFERGLVYEAADYQDLSPTQPNTSTSNQGRYSNTTTSDTYSATSPTTPAIAIDNFYSVRTDTHSATWTASLRFPAGGQEFPNSALSITLNNGTSSRAVTRRQINRLSAVQTLVVASSSSVEDYYTREITNNTPDVDGKVTFGPWVLDTSTPYDTSEDRSNTSTGTHDCGPSYTETIIDSESTTGTSRYESYTTKYTPEWDWYEPQWRVRDRTYGFVAVVSSTSVNTNPSLDNSFTAHTLKIIGTLGITSTLLETRAIGTPPNTNTNVDFNSTTTSKHGRFAYNYQSYNQYDSVHVEVWGTRVNQFGTSEVEQGPTGIGPSTSATRSYSNDYPDPDVLGSGWVDNQDSPNGMKLTRIPTDATAIEDVIVHAKDYLAFTTAVNYSHNGYEVKEAVFDGRFSLRIQKGGAAELIITEIPHASARSLRGNAISVGADSAGNPYTLFSPDVVGTDEVYVTLVTGETVQLIVIVTGATHVTDYGTALEDQRDIKWQDLSGKIHHIIHPNGDYDSLGPIESTSTTLTYRDSVVSRGTDDWTIKSGYNKYPQWDTNIVGYYEYTLIKNKLLADGMDIEDLTLTNQEISLTTTSGKPFAVILTARDRESVEESAVQLRDDRGALTVVDETNPLEWILRPHLLTVPRLRIVYIDIESQEKRMTTALDY